MKPFPIFVVFFFVARNGAVMIGEVGVGFLLCVCLCAFLNRDKRDVALKKEKSLGPLNMACCPVPCWPHMFYQELSRRASEDVNVTKLNTDRYFNHQRETK